MALHLRASLAIWTSFRAEALEAVEKYDIVVVKGIYDHVEMVLDAPKYGEEPVAITFAHGQGEVFHLISQYYLQRTELRSERHKMAAADYVAERAWPWTPMRPPRWPILAMGRWRRLPPPRACSPTSLPTRSGGT